MSGYCSNSPSRCQKARTLEVLENADNICPECGSVLIPAKNLENRHRFERNFLYLGLVVVVISLFGLVYAFFSQKGSESELNKSETLVHETELTEPKS